MDRNAMVDAAGGSGRWLTVGAGLLVGLAALALLLATVGRPARAATLCVKPGGGDGCEATIGGALALALPADTVRVAAGVYTENVYISKTVALEGGWNTDFTVRDVDAFSVTIRPADETQSVVAIEDADPIFEGFTITGGRADLGSNHGGGLRVVDSDARIFSNTIRANSAYLFGGGVWVQRGAPTMAGNRIENNASLGPGQGASGGGVTLENSAATLVGNVIAGNVVSGSTTLGGGVAVVGNEAVDLRANEILDNRALAGEMGVGGGVGIDGGGALSLTTNLIVGNRISTTNGSLMAAVHAGGGGVGVQRSGALRLADNVIGTNVISATASGDFDALVYGGGIYMSGGGMLSMDGDLVEGNRALVSDSTSSLGGGIFGLEGEAALNDVTVRGNEALTGGGAFLIDDVAMHGSTVEGNRADAGGGVYLYYPSTNGSALVEGSVISANVSTRGGGVFQNAGSLAVRGSAIISNVVSENHGGGIYSAYVLPTDVLSVTRSTILGNEAPLGAGIWSGMDVRMEGTTVISNTAGDFGGGLVTFGAATVVDSAFVGNEAGNYGAALSHGASHAAATLQNVTISGNDGGSAGAVYFDGDADLTNVTISDNGPAGIYRQSGAVTLANTILAGNDGVNCNGALTTMGHNLEDGDACGLNPGMGDLVLAEPMLKALADYGGLTPTHAIGPESPAVDAGGAAACPATDQRGVARPADGDGDGTAVCDIGAYELSLVRYYLPAILK